MLPSMTRLNAWCSSQKIDIGLAQLDHGEGIPHDEVKRRREL
jgi:hypothetical protein